MVGRKLLWGIPKRLIEQLRGQAAGVYCWNTVPGSDEVVYQTANNGYPVILCNVGNFYMDIMQINHAIQSVPDTDALNETEKKLTIWAYCTVEKFLLFPLIPYLWWGTVDRDSTCDGW